MGDELTRGASARKGCSLQGQVLPVLPVLEGLLEGPVGGQVLPVLPVLPVLEGNGRERDGPPRSCVLTASGSGSGSGIGILSGGLEAPTFKRIKSESNQTVVLPTGPYLLR
jgi:hypothetical protein